jgi:hypothetical protein
MAQATSTVEGTYKDCVAALNALITAAKTIDQVVRVTTTLYIIIYH